jgi:hypothetical protein
MLFALDCRSPTGGRVDGKFHQTRRREIARDRREAGALAVDVPVTCEPKPFTIMFDAELDGTFRFSSSSRSAFKSKTISP